MKRRVIKLGGSLLNIPDVADQLLTLIADLPAMDNFVVVGGGHAVNLIRQWNDAWHLGERRSHRMAIFAMTWNARQQFVNHSEFAAVRHFEALPDSSEISVVLAEPFLHSVMELGQRSPLPESWNITSDTIAAFVADVLGAEQLVMLKSVDCADANQQVLGVQLRPSIESPVIDVSSLDALKRLASQEIVDSEFPKYASKIPVVSWCNFRRRVQP